MGHYREYTSPPTPPPPLHHGRREEIGFCWFCFAIIFRSKVLVQFLVLFLVTLIYSRLAFGRLEEAEQKLTNMATMHSSASVKALFSR